MSLSPKVRPKIRAVRMPGRADAVGPGLFTQQRGQLAGVAALVLGDAQE
jgi:hypothetical protein